MLTHTPWGRVVRSVLPAAGLAVVLAACDVRVGDDGGVSFGVRDGRASDEWRGSYEIAPGGAIEILNTNGRIEVTPADGPRVEVLARREARGASDEAARALLEAVPIHADVTPERVVVEARRDPDARAAGGGPFGSRGPRVDYEVRVPSGIGATLRTENGEIRLEGLEGRVRASTTNGNVRASRLSGAIEASTVNGGIDVDIERMSDDARMTTVNGSIRITLGASVAARLEAGAINGAVSVDDGLPFTVESSDRRRTTGLIGGGGPALVLQTTNGAVRVTGRE